MNTKKCNQCLVIKTLDSFYNSPRSKQGVAAKCKDCCNENRRNFFATNPDAVAEERLRQKGYRNSVKDKVFEHYGQHCVCCGESERTFLTLDHINNDGAEHRRQLSAQSNARLTSPDKVWRNVIKDNFPNTFQILCYNCNCGKRDNGGTCPHEEAK